MIWRTILLILALSTAASAEIPIRTIDGDTFARDGYRYRLWGIDAPELGQVCPDGWPAGLEAKRQLEWFLANDIECNDLGTDRYGRIVTQCSFRIDGRDLAREMVLEGFAWDWPRYSHGRYTAAQSTAANGKRGLWYHGCRWQR